MAAVALASWASLASAQVVIININEPQQLPRPIIIKPYPYPHPQPIPRPIPVMEYKIKELAVEAKLEGQVAKVQASQTFQNTGNTQMEVCFVFPLPYDGAVDKLTLMVDGKEYEAKMMDATAARGLYESVVRRNQDPALLEWVGAGLFKTSVFPVPAGAERKISLRYTQLCRSTNGLTDFIFPMSTAKYTSKPVESVSVHLTIDSTADIKNVYSPSHLIDIKRPDEKHAVISYTGKDTVPSSDFRLLYDVGAGKIGTSVMSHRKDTSDEGYFMLLASPEIKALTAEQPSKTVLFVIDRSGSMAGKKLEQAKGALKFVLNNLKPNDLFNIVAYDSEVESFKPELERFTEDTRKAATGFVEGLYAGSGTNIDSGLKTALAQVKDPSRPNYIVFLTDGLPTSGVTNETQIAANAKAANTGRVRIFSFGVGYDVNSRLLDNITSQNFGQSEYVRPNEDIEERVSKFYAKVSAPVLTDVSIEFGFDGQKPEEGSPTTRVYPKGTFDLFAGQQLVVVGRYKKFGAAKVTIKGKMGGAEQRFDFPASFTEKSNDDSNAFIEKLWAVRRVGEIIDEIDLKGRNDELVKELVALATKHGIVTQYTSFLATEPNMAFDRPLAAAAQTRKSLERLESEKDGRGGFAQRRAKGDFKKAEAPYAVPPATAAAPADAAGKIADSVRATPGIAGGGASAAGRGYGGQGSGTVRYRDAEDREVVVDSVRQVGAKTFYRQKDRWVDSSVATKKAKEGEKSNVVKVERFSQQYFDLVAKYGRSLTQYLADNEAVTLELDGVIYEF
jgi:Ca-activated chloride channel family protein